LTSLTLADGQQFPIQSQLIGRSGPTTVGRDVGAVGATTATGAIIGGAVNGGVGAGIGAGAGAAAGLLGVLLTRGVPTVIYPESVLTFRMEGPITFSTTQAPQAFRLVQAGGYDQPNTGQGQPGPVPPGAAGPPAPYPSAPYPPAPYYGAGYYPYPYPYPYPYAYPYYGPGFAFYLGPSYYYRGGFYGYRGGFYGVRGGPGFRR